MNVRVGQHASGVLTSKQSPRGMAGYQTFGYTRELVTQEESRAIESRVQDAPAQGCKVRWQSYRLSPRRHVITRVVLIPEPDEFGRRGRFFTHSLICDANDEQHFGEMLCDLLRPRNFYQSLEQVLASDGLKTGDIPPAAIDADGEWLNEAWRATRGWSGEQLHLLFLLMRDPRRLIEAGECVALVGSEEQILDALKVAFLLTPVAARGLCSFDTSASGAHSNIILWGRGATTAGSARYVLDAARRHVTIPESSTLWAAAFPSEQLSSPLRAALRARLEGPADQELSALLEQRYAAVVARPICQTLLQAPELRLTSHDLELLIPLGQQYLSLGLLLALMTGDESRRLQLLAATDSASYRACVGELRGWSGFEPWQVFTPAFMRMWFETFRDDYNMRDLTTAVGKVAEHGSKQDRRGLETMHEHLDQRQRQELGSWLRTTPYRLRALQDALDKPAGDGQSNSLWHRVLHTFSK